MLRPHRRLAARWAAQEFLVPSRRDYGHNRFEIATSQCATGFDKRMSLMELIINGESREVPSALTVAELVNHLGLADGPVAVEVNRAIVTRANHATHQLLAGDVVELVRFVGGG